MLQSFSVSGLFCLRYVRDSLTSLQKTASPFLSVKIILLHLLLSLSSKSGTIVCFYILDHINKVVINMGAHIRLQTLILINLDDYCEVKFLNHR